MCLAIPLKVVERLADDQAVVEVGGVRNRVSVALVPDAAIGDYVIVHAGFALVRLDVAEAEKSLELFRQIAETLKAPRDAVH